MAATLIELKTKMLLPRDPLAAAEEEEDPRADLVNQLLEYQKYKAAAEKIVRERAQDREALRFSYWQDGWNGDEQAARDALTDAGEGHITSPKSLSNRSADELLAALKALEGDDSAKSGVL